MFNFSVTQDEMPVPTPRTIQHQPLEADSELPVGDEDQIPEDW